MRHAHLSFPAVVSTVVALSACYDGPPGGAAPQRPGSSGVATAGPAGDSDGRADEDTAAGQTGLTAGPGSSGSGVSSATGGEGSGGDGTGTEPETWGCEGNSFAFGMFSDNYSGQEGGMRRVFEELGAVEDLEFITSGGDTPSFERVRTVLDETLDPDGTGGPCGSARWPWFPSTGNHDAEVVPNMLWWKTEWATPWAGDAALSPLAQQLSGLGNFSAGPEMVEGGAGSLVTDAGTIFSFDYKNTHFVFVNDYAQGVSSDNNAGVWDNNAGVDATNSQLDWLREDLAENVASRTFVFGHVALLAPCYNYDPPSGAYDCPGPPPPGWSEHNSNFHTLELTALLAEYDVAAYFHGHDHVLSRMLIDGERNAVFERKYWETSDDPAGAMGEPSTWETLQGPGRVWQVDTGRVYTQAGQYGVVRVTPSEVTFELYAYESSEGPTILWDTWTVAVGS